MGLVARSDNEDENSKTPELQENLDQTVKNTYVPRHADGGPVGFF